MADVGPVGLEEARDVLHDRLVTLDWDPPARRYGPRVRRHAASGARPERSASCSCPGLAERVVPQRPREDPLLLDEARRALGRGAGRPGRAEPRRATAAEDRDRRGERAAVPLVSRGSTSAETRARVPSFYALDVMRAITGGCPTIGAGRRRGRGGGREPRPGRRPRDPDRAIDDLEHDLAVAQAAARFARSARR